MGYSITISKNIILDSSEVQLNTQLNSILGDESETITISKNIYDLSGWNVAEIFDSFRPDANNEISKDSLIEFLMELAASDEDYSDIVNHELLDDTKRDWIFFTYSESY